MGAAETLLRERGGLFDFHPSLLPRQKNIIVIFITMELKINVPDYLSLKHWKRFVANEHLEPTEKMITLLSTFSDMGVDELMKFKPSELSQIYEAVLSSLRDLEPQFYPIFELDGVLYGFSSLSKLSLGEYVDLERLAKKPQDNIEEIMAILYRPITKNRFNGIKWAFKNKHKVALGDAENLFKYYELEEYDSSERSENADKLSVIPASIALGALSFFLVLANSSLIGSSLSSLPPKQAMKEMEKMNKQMASMSIGAGLLQFITSQVHPSFQSQEIEAYLS